MGNPDRDQLITNGGQSMSSSTSTSSTTQRRRPGHYADDLPVLPGAATRAPSKTDDFFFTMLLMAVFLPGIFFLFAYFGKALITVPNVFALLMVISIFIVYTYYKERYA